MRWRDLSASGLSFFRRTNSRGNFTLASFHSPHSLTWSWILSLQLPRAGSGRWLAFWRHRDNNGLQWGVQFLRAGLQWHRQQPMLYRDLCRRAWDERDGLAEQRRARVFPPAPVEQRPFDAPLH